MRPYPLERGLALVTKKIGFLVVSHVGGRDMPLKLDCVTGTAHSAGWSL